MAKKIFKPSDIELHSGPITADGSTLSHVAAYFGNQPILEKMLELHPRTMYAANKDGSNPLHLAVAGGQLSAMTSMIKNYPDLLNSEENDGWTIAHIACFHGKLEILRLIGSKKPSILFRPDADGLRPYDVCVEESCRLFIKSISVDQQRQSGSKLNLETQLQSLDIGSLGVEPNKGNLDDDSSLVLVDDLEVHLNAELVLFDGSDYLSISSQHETSPIRDAEENCSVRIAGHLNDATSGEVDCDQCSGDENGAGTRLSMKRALNCEMKESSTSNVAKLTGEASASYLKKNETNETENWRKDTTTREQESRWKSLLSSLKQGTDISKIQIPAEFLRPESALERIQDIMQHGKFLEDIPNAPTDLERMIAVVRFHVSGILFRLLFFDLDLTIDGRCHTGDFRREKALQSCARRDVFMGIRPQMRKRLREQNDLRAGFICSVLSQIESYPELWYDIFKVSHHPPISAYYLENTRLGIRIQVEPGERFHSHGNVEARCASRDLLR